LKKETVAGTVAGVRGLGKVMHEWPEALSGCTEIKPYVEKLKAYRASLAGKSYATLAVTLGKNIWWNWNDIDKNAKALAHNFIKHWWRTAGSNAAKVLLDALGSLAPAVDKTPSKAVAKPAALPKDANDPLVKATAE